MFARRFASSSVCPPFSRGCLAVTFEEDVLYHILFAIALLVLAYTDTQAFEHMVHVIRLTSFLPPHITVSTGINVHALTVEHKRYFKKKACTYIRT